MRVAPRAVTSPGEDRLVPRRLHERLGGKIVDLVGAMLLEDLDQRILVMQIAGFERDVVLDMRDASVVLGARAPHDAHDVIAALKEKFGHV